MKPKKFSAFLVIFLVMGAPLEANPVERACNGSDRAAANRGLCSCIGSVARLTLSRSQQRQAARLFDDPDEAEVLRMSDNRSDEAFWESYTTFGEQATQSCS